MSSLVLDIVNEDLQKRDNGDFYNGVDNTIFYGTGKSNLIASYSEYIDKDVIAISPAGTSAILEDVYPKFHCANVGTIKEAEDIIKAIEEDVKKIKIIRRAIKFKDEKVLIDVKRRLKNEYDSYYNFAKTNTYPIGALAIEESSTISNWIEYRIADEMGLDNLGEDKKVQGLDWSILKKRTWNFFSAAMRLPIPVFLSCNVIEPSEKRELSQRVPNLCTGAARNMIIENVGNVFYVSSDNNNKYTAQIIEDSSSYCKNKLKPAISNVKINKAVDITGAPKNLFTYLDEITMKVKQERESKQIKK